MQTTEATGAGLGGGRNSNLNVSRVRHFHFRGPSSSNHRHFQRWLMDVQHARIPSKPADYYDCFHYLVDENLIFFHLFTLACCCFFISLAREFFIRQPPVSVCFPMIWDNVIGYHRNKGNSYNRNRIKICFTWPWHVLSILKRWGSDELDRDDR